MKTCLLLASAFFLLNENRGLKKSSIRGTAARHKSIVLKVWFSVWSRKAMTEKLWWQKSYSWIDETPTKNTGPLSDERRPALNPTLHAPEFSDFLLTRWQRNILFEMFFEESVAVE